MDWDLATKIVMPVASAFIGAFLSRALQSKAKLVTYYGHVSSFRVRPSEGEPFVVHAHTVVIRNGGRSPAKNVRVGHLIMPEHVEVHPPVSYTLDKLPGGECDLVIPQLVPSEQVTISYLYYPPLTYNQTNTTVKCDDGLAKVIPVIPVRHYPSWVYRALSVLVVIGCIAVVYVTISAIVFIAHALAAKS